MIRFNYFQIRKEWDKLLRKFASQMCCLRDIIAYVAGPGVFGGMSLWLITGGCLCVFRNVFGIVADIYELALLHT